MTGKNRIMIFGPKTTALNVVELAKNRQLILRPFFCVSDRTARAG